MGEREQALTQLLVAARRVFGPDNVSPMEDDPTLFYATAVDGTGVYFTTRHPSAPEAPAREASEPSTATPAREGDGLPEDAGAKQRLIDLCDGWDAASTAPSEAGMPRLRADIRTIISENGRLRAALAAAQGGGGQAVEVLARLIALKDGPRDERYAVEKVRAWEDARRVLLRAAHPTEPAPPAVQGGGGADESVFSDERTRLALAVAQEFHAQYERLAPSFGYETRRETSVPWDDLPDDNRDLMVAVSSFVVGKFIEPGPGGGLDREAARRLLDEALTLRNSIYYEVEPGPVERAANRLGGVIAELEALLTEGGRDG